MAVTEIADGGALVAALPADGFLVALDGGGRTPDSVALSRLLQGWIELARPVCFAIGGADGLDGSVLARADYVLSLGALTWPHLLVRGLLAEQIYRARSIAAGHPYHRGNKPS